MHEPVVVVGLGRSGTGAARLLNGRGQNVWLIESKQTSELQLQADQLALEGIQVELGQPLALASFEALVPPPSRVVVSPGIPFDHPVLNQLRDRGIEVVGEMQVAWEGLSGVPWIGITGTNGKTTVTSLVGHLLQQAGLDAPVCGNIGSSAAELALACQNGRKPDWAVVELSSFQIEAAVALAPRIGVWTTLTPDHLDRHGSVDNYRSIKAGLLRHCELQILNGDDPDLRAHADAWPDAGWVTTGAKEDLPAGARALLWMEGDQVVGPKGPLLDARALAMPGAHNRQNLLLAAAVAQAAGVSGEQMEAACRSFPGVAHRLELIRVHRGVSYYNDSKATNYDASLGALQALARPLVLLAGGRAKRGEPASWLQALGEKAVAVVLFGEAMPTFKELLGASGYSGRIEQQEHLDQALPLAQALAEELGASSVLLSPACASFDQYRNFELRGEHFRQLVQALPPTP
jgi:UDP-N-acetylmuramoylalanine--D-glutamate ligase